MANNLPNAGNDSAATAEEICDLTAQLHRNNSLNGYVKLPASGTNLNTANRNNQSGIIINMDSTNLSDEGKSGSHQNSQDTQERIEEGLRTFGEPWHRSTPICSLPEDERVNMGFFYTNLWGDGNASEHNMSSILSRFEAQETNVSVLDHQTGGNANRNAGGGGNGPGVKNRGRVGQSHTTTRTQTGDGQAYPGQNVGGLRYSTTGFIHTI